MENEREVIVPGYFLLFLAALIASGPISTYAYMPALPIMAQLFAVDIVAMNNTISTYLLGNALGILLGGPISDRIGRKHVALTGLVLFVLASLSIALATTVGQIQILRIIQAVGGGLATVICIPSIRDIYSAREAGRKFAVVMMIMKLAPLIAPVLGAVLLKIGWQAIFVMLTAYGLMLLVWYAAGIPETRKGPRQKISLGTIFSQYLAVITHKTGGRYIAIRYALAMALVGGVMMTFLINAPFAYIQYFGVSESFFPVLFAATPLGLMIANMVSMRLMKEANPQTVFNIGNVLQLLGVATLVLIVYLELDSLLTVVPLLVLSIAMSGIINPCGLAIFMSYFKELSGSAASIITTTMFTLGAGFGALSGLFYDGTLIAMTGTMLLATVLANIVAHSIPKATIEDS